MEKLLTERDDKKIIDERKFSDISLVAYLVCEGFKMTRIERTATRDSKSYFYFEDVATLEQTALNYFNHEAKVDPLRFSETLRNLRSYAKQG